MKRTAGFLASGMLAAHALALAAAGIGDTLPELALADVHGKPRVLDGGVTRIYATPDRAAGEIVKAALAGHDDARLAAERAIVIADISAAPGFVRGMIRSGLKKRRYAIWLDESGATTPLLPWREGQVTVLDLDQRRITAIRHAADAEALRRELPPAPAPVQ